MTFPATARVEPRPAVLERRLRSSLGLRQSGNTSRGSRRDPAAQSVPRNSGMSACKQTPVTASHERCSASGTRTYDRCLGRPLSGTFAVWDDRCLGQLRHAELHWLAVADRVMFKLCMMVRCLHSAPSYPV